MDHDQLVDILTEYKWHNKPLEETIACITNNATIQPNNPKRIKDVRDLKQDGIYRLIWKGPGQVFEIKSKVASIGHASGNDPIPKFTFHINHKGVKIDILADLSDSEWELYETE